MGFQPQHNGWRAKEKLSKKIIIKKKLESMKHQRLNSWEGIKLVFFLNRESELDLRGSLGWKTRAGVDSVTVLMM